VDDVELVVEVLPVMVDRDGIGALCGPQRQPRLVVKPVEHVGFGPDETRGFLECNAHAVIILFHC
jgi:hypothetical protein